MEAILRDWEEFARTIAPGTGMDSLALRDHAEPMLLAIADDLCSSQSEAQRKAKSRGESEPAREDTAATVHGGLRFLSQFSISQLAAEFRALRATVLRLWTIHGGGGGDEAVRFNEAIDQALAESIAAFTEKSNYTRDLFIGVLGHDLRAPLATIGSAADVLLVHPDLPVALQLGGSIKRATRHMAGMIENVINYARLQLGGGLATQIAMVDLGAICGDAIVDARNSFPASQFELEIDGDARAPFDPVTIRQLCTNLFVNAAQHGDLDQPILVALRRNDADITLCVSNRGRSIPAAEIASLFEPLVRVSAADATSRLGRSSMGLGLFIARAVVEAHGGSILATSSPDGVTRFVARLPAPARRATERPAP